MGNQKGSSDSNRDWCSRHDIAELEMWLGETGVSIRTETLQKSTFLGTARILRRALEM